MAESADVDGPDLTQGVPLSKLEEGVPLVGTVEDEAVVVVKKNERLFAIGARCTHYGGRLEKGLVVDDTIRCPLHHAVFDLHSGRAIGAPAFDSVGCYPVEIDGFHFRVLPKQPSTSPEPVEAGPESVVIVGAGAAAAAATETLRQEGYTGPIAMIGAERSGPVDRPNLSKDYLAGQAPEEWIPLGGDEHWEQLDTELIAGDPVVDIDRAGRTVRTESGRTLDYDRLLYATGAQPIVPPIGGLDSTDYHTLRSLDDVRAIIDAAEQGQNALVVGASFIGLEVAASLRTRGLEVTVAAPESVPLATSFGDELGNFVQSIHEEEGVQFELGAKVENLDGDAGIARLTNSSEVEFDFLVLGVGVKPRTELAEKAGLEVDDGVVVDQTLTTSDDHIFAAGDAARYPNPITGTPTRIEHWVVAQRQAQTAARNMLAGDGEAHCDIPFFWSRHFDVTIRYVGHAPHFDEVVIDGSIADCDAAVGYLQDGEVCAVATVGRSVDGLRAEWAFEDRDQSRLRALVGA